MDAIEEIKSYQPFNEQEAKDKELILEFLKKNPNAFYRSNLIAHMTASAWVTNPTWDKVLLCYHKIYNSWSWLGGHADGNENLLQVALQEVKEESGLDTAPYDGKIFSLESLTVDGHEKRGQYVSSHLHLNVTYLLIGDENKKLIKNEEENLGVKWFSLQDALLASTEPWFVKRIYSKLITKMKLLKQ